MGYHLTEIERGEYGEFSKIREEFLEAERQLAKEEKLPPLRPEDVQRDSPWAMDKPQRDPKYYASAAERSYRDLERVVDLLTTCKVHG